MKNNIKHTAPTASELSILQLLWTNGPLLVKDVHGALDLEACRVYHCAENDAGAAGTPKSILLPFEKCS